MQVARLLQTVEAVSEVRRAVYGSVSSRALNYQQILNQVADFSGKFCCFFGELSQFDSTAGKFCNCVFFQ